jgi:hypothetical protein
MVVVKISPVGLVGLLKMRVRMTKIISFSVWQSMVIGFPISSSCVTRHAHTPE